ncbi:MAG: sugar phosphate isomerase/epimerase, partial [Planctomycetota bacterium]
MSGFSDEAAIDKTVDQQFSAVAAIGMSYLTLRFLDVGNGIKNIMQLSEDEVDIVLQKLDD